MTSPLRLFTSESVTEGHPDKIADRVSDSVLDFLMANDGDRANLRTAVETLLTTGLVVVAGEVRTNAYAPVAELVREVILEIGYDSSDKGFDYATCGVSVAIGAQSPDIAQGVDQGHEARVGSSDEIRRIRSRITPHSSGSFSSSNAGMLPAFSYSSASPKRSRASAGRRSSMPRSAVMRSLEDMSVVPVIAEPLCQ